MRIFQCGHCDEAVYFDNRACVHCGTEQGYDPQLFAMRPVGEGDRLCANARHEACNWLVAEDDQDFCLACRHNATIPDISVEENLVNWRRIEDAKRHLFYSLMRWRLPAPTKAQDEARGLAFEFLSDIAHEDGTVEQVMTGHADGLITINIAEGDDAERERRRTAMDEPYRTLLGHFRHEIGHYYWDRLVRDGGRLEDFRAVFGDERQDYGQALKRHHEEGPPSDWFEHHISAYATAHPWEDFAESFAHFVHIVDTLETARAWSLHLDLSAAVSRDGFDPYLRSDVDQMLSIFVPMTLAINAINRSMGQPDLYPFVLSPPVAEKLCFVADIVVGSQNRAP